MKVMYGKNHWLVSCVTLCRTMQKYIVKQGLIALLVYIGQVTVGFGFSSSAPVIPKLQDINQTPLSDVITDRQASWVASLLYLGAVIGPHTSGYLSSKYGRRLSMMLGGFLMGTAFVLQAIALDLTMIYAGRILVGLGNSIVIVAILIYLGEISSANIRGVILSGTVISNAVGTVVVYSTAPFVSYAVVFYIGLGITCAFIIAIVQIPESPVYYVLQGKEQDAKRSMIALGRTDPEDITRILSLQQIKVTETGFKGLLHNKSTRKALFICVGITILMQWSGVSVVVLLSTTIFEMAGSAVEPHIATIMMGVTQLGAGTLALFFVERSGRRVLLLWSSLISCLSLASLAIYFYIDVVGHNIQPVGWIPLASLIIYLMAYNMGLGIIPPTLIGELFGRTSRSLGSSITLTIDWLVSFAVLTAFAYMVDSIGAHFTFWIFACASLCAFFFTLFFIPETKGKTLSEIQEMLST